MPIRRHLAPGERRDHTNLQVKMNTPLVEEVKSRMKVDGVSWNELLTACFTAYLEESKGQPPVDLDGEEKNLIVSPVVGIVILVSIIESRIFQVITDLSDYWV